MNIAMNVIVVAAVSGVLLFLAIFLRKRKPLPPGPRPVPVLGHIRDLRRDGLCVRATAWSKEYGNQFASANRHVKLDVLGDVCYLHKLGYGAVFLNTLDAAVDLLDKRGAIYSDRARFVMHGELCVFQP
jgi:hypothetical protein